MVRHFLFGPLEKNLRVVKKMVAHQQENRGATLKKNFILSRNLELNGSLLAHHKIVLVGS